MPFFQIYLNLSESVVFNCRKIIILVQPHDVEPKKGFKSLFERSFFPLGCRLPSLLLRALFLAWGDRD